MLFIKPQNCYPDLSGPGAEEQSDKQWMRFLGSEGLMLPVASQRRDTRRWEGRVLDPLKLEVGVVVSSLVGAGSSTRAASALCC